jgi:phosphoserine phosphatase
MGLGWDPAVETGLDEIFLPGSLAGRRAVFDFDGTVIAGDVTETVASRGWARGIISAHALWSVLGCANDPPHEGPFAAYEGIGASDNFDGFPHGHHAASALLAQAFAGLTVADVVTLTRHAVQDDVLARGPLRPLDPVLDLIGRLHAAGAECWVLTAGLVWCVRTLMQDVINPALVARGGKSAAIPGGRVVGVSTLIRDGSCWWSDRQLVRSERGHAYASLDELLLASLEITSAVVGPVTFGGGKVGAWLELPPFEPPLLMVGDGAGDVPLMRMSEHALWIAPHNGASPPPGLPVFALKQETDLRVQRTA